MDYEKKLLSEIEEIKMSEIPIVLYGVGEVCQICIRAIEALGISCPIYMCDRDVKLQNTCIYKGYVVHSLEEIIASVEKANFIICAYRRKTVLDISSFLKENIPDKIGKLYQKEALIYYYTVNVMKRKVDSYKYAETVSKIAKASGENNFSDSDIGVTITSHCNLRCKNCGYLLGYIGKRKDYNPEKIVRSVYNFVNSVGYCEMITLVGGEPFLSADLVWIADQISRISEVMVVRMVSNGGLMPKDNVICALKDKVSCVLISDYGKLSVYSQQMVEKLNEQGVLCYMGYRNTFNEWYPVCAPEKSERTLEELYSRMEKCPENKNQYYIKDGKLFICGYSAWAMTEQLMEPMDGDFVDLLEDGFKERLADFRDKKVLRCCEYCQVGLGESVPAGEQMDIKEEI